MRSNQDHIFSDLTTADAEWNAQYGNTAIDSAYLQHLAHVLTAMGWVQIHNHDSHEGKQQAAVAEAKILRGINNNDQPPAAIASDVFVGLLNPTHYTEEVTR